MEESNFTGLDSEGAFNKTEGEENYLKDLQRVMAEYSNFRKRSVREYGSAKSKGQGEVLKELLRVYDNVMLFNEHEESEALKVIRNGIEELFKSFGVERFGAAGEEFDYNLHEAVDVVESDGKDGLIVKVIEYGFYFEGALLRSCKVVVGRNT